MHRMFDNINGTVNDFLKKKFTPFDKIFKNTFNFQVFILDCSVTTKSDVEHFRFQKDLIKLLSIISFAVRLRFENTHLILGLSDMQGNVFFSLTGNLSPIKKALIGNTGSGGTSLHSESPSGVAARKSVGSASCSTFLSCGKAMGMSRRADVDVGWLSYRKVSFSVFVFNINLNDGI